MQMKSGIIHCFDIFLHRFETSLINFVPCIHLPVSLEVLFEVFILERDRCSDDRKITFQKIYFTLAFANFYSFVLKGDIND